MCPKCGSGNVTDHMVWDGTGFAGGNRRCENCNTIFGTATEAPAVEAPAEEPADEGDEPESEEPTRRGRRRAAEEAD